MRGFCKLSMRHVCYWGWGISVAIERMRNEYSCGEVFEVMEKIFNFYQNVRQTSCVEYLRIDGHVRWDVAVEMRKLCEGFVNCQCHMCVLLMSQCLSVDDELLS